MANHEKKVASGRFISTGHIHLQRVTAITFDPSDNFILTGSADSNVYTWAVPILTDFRSERKPERILDHHQREITSIVCGKGDGPANICITASRDLSCIVRDTYLLSFAAFILVFKYANNPVS